MPTPIAYQRIKTSTGVLNIPIYNVGDVALPIVRVATPSLVGAYDLVDVSNATPIRIRTSLGVKGVNTEVVSGGSVTSLIDFSNYSLQGVTTSLMEDTPDYIKVHTDSNGNGIALPFLASIGNTLSCSVNVDILQGVDDVISVRIWNATQNKWITSNMKTGTQTSGLHNLSNTFTLAAAHLNNGDQLELRIVQSWKNSTHDDFIFKVLKTSTLYAQ